MQQQLIEQTKLPRLLKNDQDKLDPAPPSIKIVTRKTNTLQNVAVLKVLLNAIAIRPRTQPEIIELTGLSNSTVSRWLRFLHVHTKGSRNLVYISEWKRTGERGNWSACWSLGYDMPDAIKPKPLTMSEYNKRWRKKQAKQPTVTVTDKGIKHVVE
jgi:hypothetical protein